MNLLRAMVLLLLAMPTSLFAMPKNSPLAMCTRSATLLACQDGNGSSYSVRSEGSTFYLRGYDFSSRRLWAQTNSRYGTLTFLPAWPAMAKPGWVTAVALAGPS